jgi:hypothetical protein
MIFFRASFGMCLMALSAIAQMPAPLPPAVARIAFTNYAVVVTAGGTNISAPSNEVSWTNSSAALSWLAPTDSTAGLLSSNLAHYELEISRSPGAEKSVSNIGTNLSVIWPPPPLPTVVTLCVHLEVSTNLTTWTETNFTLFTTTNPAGAQFFRTGKKPLEIKSLILTN